MAVDTLNFVRKQFSEAVSAYDVAKDAIVGRDVRIVSDYNGQPFGRSKRSLRGQVRRVLSIHFDMHWGISLRIEGCGLYIRLDEVELV